MKKASYIHRAVTLPVLSVTALLLMATAQNSKAVVTITFEETGGNVVATISGSMDLSGLGVPGLIDYPGSRGSAGFNNTRFLQIGRSLSIGTFDRYNNGVATTTDLLVDLNSTSYTHTVEEAFGFSGTQLYVPGEVPDNSPTYTPAPGMSVTWEGETLASIGLGSLTDTPLTAWNNPFATGTNGSIQYVGPAVPEPSSSLLLGLAGLGYISRRKR